MKHYLHIWALLMLFIHLSALAPISFVPTKGGTGSFKKVCIRKVGKAIVAAKETYTFTKLVLQKTEAEVPVGEPEVRLCSVKLISTAALYAAVFTTPLFPYQQPPYLHLAYSSLNTPTNPDPPRMG